MKLVFSRQPAGPEACGVWSRAADTAPHDGPSDGVADLHEATVSAHGGEEPMATFAVVVVAEGEPFRMKEAKSRGGGRSPNA